MALILADSKTLPLDYEMYAFELGLYTTSLEDRIRDANITSNIDTSPLRAAVNTLSIISADVRESYERVENLSWFQLREYNDRLLLAERSFLLPEGLDGKAEGFMTDKGLSFERRWERHAVYAPVSDNSYGMSFFPGIFDALNAVLKDDDEGIVTFKDVQSEVWRVTRAILDVAKQLQGRLV